MKTKITDGEALARLESFDPTRATMRPRSATEAIEAAVAARVAAQDRVDAAVDRARHDGLTWIEIGLALGVSPQAARQRYGAK